MNKNNLLNIATNLVSKEWMLNPISQANLYKSVINLMNGQSNPLPPTYGEDANNSDFVIGADENSDFIAIIPINGILMKGCSETEEMMLGLCNTDKISDAIDDAIEDPNVTEIVLHFNSPGGSTVGIEELGRKIRKADSIKPIIAFTETTCASAAYWLASQARIIGMTPSATIGNVGVYALIEDTSKQMEMQGVNIQAIYSGKYKLMGHPFQPLTEEETKILQDDVIKQHNKFKAVIKSNRDIDDANLEGLSYEGEDALKYNFVDYVVDSFEEFLTTQEEDSQE